jgi:bifunctional ADP-heptose synthase (sugar kinase/adenylyltransferase)
MGNPYQFRLFLRLKTLLKVLNHPSLNLKNKIKVGITFSAFDLFHPGHVKMLEEAKTKCDYLIVGLQTVQL